MIESRNIAQSFVNSVGRLWLQWDGTLWPVNFKQQMLFCCVNTKIVLQYQCLRKVRRSTHSRNVYTELLMHSPLGYPSRFWSWTNYVAKILHTYEATISTNVLMPKKYVLGKKGENQMPHGNLPINYSPIIYLCNSFLIGQFSYKWDIPGYIAIETNIAVWHNNLG